MADQISNDYNLKLNSKTRISKIVANSSQNSKEDVKANVKLMQLNLDNHIALIRKKYNYSLSKLMKIKNMKNRRNSTGFDFKDDSLKMETPFNISQELSNNCKSRKKFVRFD